MGIQSYHALLFVPDNWSESEIIIALQSGLQSKVIRDYRNTHQRQAFPPHEEMAKVSVLSLTKAETEEIQEVIEQTEDKLLEERQPKLDRKTRGQVRRVTNKLKTLEKREFPSSSNPNRRYEAVIYIDGQILCNCQGWTIKKPGKPRQCRHTAELIGDRAVIDNGEFQFLASLATAHHHTED